MPWLNAVLLFYALLTLVMGLLGYINKHSVPSLIAGTAAAVIILAALAFGKRNPRASRITCLVIAVLLLGRFATKALSNELYPSGIMFVCSLIVIVCLGAGHMMGMKAKKVREAAEKK